jgi:hypothetical protein
LFLFQINPWRNPNCSTKKIDRKVLYLSEDPIDGRDQKIYFLSWDYENMEPFIQKTFLMPEFRGWKLGLRTKCLFLIKILKRYLIKDEIGLKMTRNFRKFLP